MAILAASAVAFRDRYGATDGIYGFEGMERLAVGVAEATTAAKLPPGLYDLVPTVECFIKHGTATPTVVTDTDGHLLIAGERVPLHLSAAGGEYLGVIRYDVDGFLYVSRRG